MTASTFAPVSPVSVVADLQAQVGELDEVLWAARAPGELVEVVTELERLKSVVEAVELRVVAEVEATRAAAQAGWASTKDLVAAVAGARRGHGGVSLRLAQALEAQFPALRAALAAGTVSRAQAQVIVTAVDQLPTKPVLRAEAERVMLDHARTLPLEDLVAAGRHLVEVVDPDRAERDAERDLDREERAAHLGRYLALSEDGAGGVRIKGRATVEDAAVIRSALLSLAAPAPTEPGACGGAGAGAQRRPGACGVPDCAHDGRDPREHGARFLDALVEACRMLHGVDVLPDSHGATPRVTITMSYADLVDGLGGLGTGPGTGLGATSGGGVLETGESLSSAAVRRLACDAHLIPMVLGSHGEVLDVGRTQRLVTAAIWKALVVRDRHCTFPGCRRPPIMCDAHHLQHWADGGVTSLDNLGLLCRTHHRMIHQTPWQIRLNPTDRRPEFLPPPHLDPDRRPTRVRHPRE